MGTVRYRVIYEGRVQGVGFRYTTASIARRHPVSGYVKNLADGTVEVQVEGPRERVDAFLRDVAAVFGENITHSTVQEASPDVSQEGFHIRH